MLWKAPAQLLDGHQAFANKIRQQLEQVVGPSFSTVHDIKFAAQGDLWEQK